MFVYYLNAGQIRYSLCDILLMVHVAKIGLAPWDRISKRLSRLLFTYLNIERRWLVNIWVSLSATYDIEKLPTTQSMNTCLGGSAS